MNEEDYQRGVMRRLQNFARNWLQVLQESMATLTPHEFFPFPERFPFTDTVMPTAFRWTEFRGASPRHYDFPAAFRFVQVPPDPSTPGALQDICTRWMWTVACTFLSFRPSGQ